MASSSSFKLAAYPLHCPSCLVPSNWPAKYLRCEFYDQIKFSLCIQKKSNQGQHFYQYLLCDFAWKKHQTTKCKKLSCKRGDFSQQHLIFSDGVKRIAHRKKLLRLIQMQPKPIYEYFHMTIILKQPILLFEHQMGLVKSI